MKRAFVFQPFLLLLYPILMTYNHNIGYLTLNVLFRPIIVALCCVLVLLLLAMLFIRDIHKAGIFITLIILLFFCSLPFCEQVDGWANSRTSVLIIKCLAVLISLVYLALFAYGIIKMRKQIALNIAIVMNTIVIVLVLFPVFNIGEHEFHKRQIWKHDRLIKEIKNGTASTENGKLPNIFYVILDGYARNDVLKEIYDYDNSEFWDYLNNKGFYIATRARSNYNQTALSLASSLNMDYLNDLLIDIDNNSSDRYLLYSLIRHNDVIRFLQQYGYKFVTFSSPFAAVDIKNSDIYKPTGFHLNELENCLIKGTVLSALSKKLVFLNQYDLHRQTILRTFSCLADMAQCEGPLPYTAPGQSQDSILTMANAKGRTLFTHILLHHTRHLFSIKRVEKLFPRESFLLMKVMLSEALRMNIGRDTKISSFLLPAEWSLLSTAL